MSRTSKRFQTNDFSFDGNVAFGTLRERVWVPRRGPGPQQIIWGDRVVWDELLHFYASVWGIRIIWGDHITAGTQIIWGDRPINWNDNATSVVWSDRTLWGNRIVWAIACCGSGQQDWSDGEQIIWGDTSSNINDLQIIWGDPGQIAELWGLTA